MGLGGGCYTLMKYLVFILNVLFWVSGLALIGISIWMFTDPMYINTQDQLNYNIGVFLLLAIGILLFVVGFLGCLGIVRSSKVLLVLFSCILLLILVAEISAAAWAYVNRDALKTHIEQSVQYTVEKEYGVDSARTEAFDVIQTELKCCGAYNWNDWLKNKALNKEEGLDLSSKIKEYQIPESCCREQPAGPACIRKFTAAKSETFPYLEDKVQGINSEGCAQKFIDGVEGYSLWMIIVGAILVATQILGLIFSLIICCSIEKPHYRAINTRNKL
uniref:Tetraspanin n=3 Tax=Lygus hesperus TaxID=30085 RepID=A0A0A9ZIZ4_LYGHE